MATLWPSSSTLNGVRARSSSGEPMRCQVMDTTLLHAHCRQGVDHRVVSRRGARVSGTFCRGARSREGPVAVRLLLQCLPVFGERVGGAAELQQHVTEQLTCGRERARRYPPFLGPVLAAPCSS